MTGFEGFGRLTRLAKIHRRLSCLHLEQIRRRNKTSRIVLLSVGKEHRPRIRKQASTEHFLRSAVSWK